MANSEHQKAKHEQRKNDLRLLADGLLHSYSQIFFSIDKPFAVMLLLASFIDLYAGISGLVAALLANLMAFALGFDRKALSEGVYGFNPLMVGMVLGVYYQFNLPFALALVIVTILTFMVGVTGSSLLGKYRLPLMSIPFLFGTWTVLLIGRSYTGLQLSGRGIYTINELYSYGGPALVDLWQQIETLPIPRLLDVYLRSVGAIFFQYNLFSGILMTLGLLWFSRIAFTLSLVGFFSGYFFVGMMQGGFSDINYSYIGFNFILSAIALGGFFVVPGRASVLLVVVTSPLIAMLITAIGYLMAPFALPMYSLPYNLTVVLVLHTLRLRVWPRWLHLVDDQQYSPERHLYSFINRAQRFATSTWYHLYLPFFGEWKVSQAHAGAVTHKGDWAHAWDFVIDDAEGNTYRLPGTEPADYYCYDRPVLAPQAGTVVAVEAGIADNPIKGVNMERNWGNAVVIMHGEHFYTKLSHLRPGTVKVAVGDVVKRGQPIGTCGNSGRSPEPHLHFQAQATPFIGSKTLDFPLAYYLRTDTATPELHCFDRPQEGWKVANINTDSTLRAAFDWIPGRTILWSDGAGGEGRWEVHTDAFNLTYLWCPRKQAMAYFVNDGTMCYFTHFVGDRSSILYRFHLAFHRVLLAHVPGVGVTDALRVDSILHAPLLWAVDLLAPLHVPVRSTYTAMVEAGHEHGKLVIDTRSQARLFGQPVAHRTASMTVGEGGIEEFTLDGERYLCIGS